MARPAGPATGKQRRSERRWEKIRHREPPGHLHQPHGRQRRRRRGDRPARRPPQQRSHRTVHRHQLRPVMTTCWPLASGNREPGRMQTCHSVVKFRAAAPVGVLACLMTASACGSAGPRDPESPVTAAASSAPAASHCAVGSGFALSLVSNRHGQRTPLGAAIWFSAHGGVPAIPHNGWRVTSRNGAGATVESGSVTVHVIQARTRHGRSIAASGVLDKRLTGFSGD